MSQTPPTELRLLHLHIANNEIYINNTKIISRYSVSRLKVMHILLSQFWQDFKNGLPPEKYKFLNINQLADRLSLNPTIHNLEHKIRRPLNRIITTIKKKLSEEFGLDCNNVIESVG